MSSTLQFKSVLENPDLVSPSVLHAVNTSSDTAILVAEIDPKYMGGKELCEHYGVNLDEGANCVIVEVVRSDNSEYVAIVIPVGHRADLNGIVRKHLGARRVSLAPLERILAITGMEYGSITPLGLPNDWKKLIDTKLLDNESIVVGGGKQISKLRIPIAVLVQQPNTEVILDLSSRIE